MSTVYARVLGEAGLEALSPECRALHASHGAFDGVIDVETTTNPLFRFALRVFGFPYKPGQASVIFSNTAKGDVDNWQRQMGDHRMSSILSEKDGWLHESLGGLTVLCRLETRDGGLDLIDMRFRLLGVPLPLWACPKVSASERPKKGGYGFDIEIKTPWGGKLVRYSGVLRTL
ncbi:MAG: DUF4166 domain-containing protein [Pseudomonadota bacterium]